MQVLVATAALLSSLVLSSGAQHDALSSSNGTEPRRLAFALRTCTYGFSSFNFVGGDIENVQGSVSRCGPVCRQIPTCTAYTWTDYNGGTCWLKRPAEYQLSYEEGSISTYIQQHYADSCPIIRIKWRDRDFEGDDLSNARGTDAVDCYGQCRTLKGCWAFTWSNYNGGTCWFKNANALRLAKTAYAPGKHSGILAQTNEIP